MAGTAKGISAEVVINLSQPEGSQVARVSATSLVGANLGRTAAIRLERPLAA
jgi:hypothetical protein